MNRRTAVVVCFLSTLGVASVSSAATILGDDYFLDGNNFPVNFPGSSPLTFDGIAELAPGSGNRLSVNEQIIHLGPNGEEVLQFQFTFLSLPNNTNAGFAFQLRGLDWDGFPGDLVASEIRFCIDCTTPLVRDADLFVTPFVDASGLNLLFQTPAGRTWNDVFDFSGGPPSSMLVEFRAAVFVPEPSTVSLIAFGLLFAARRALRKRA